MPIFSYRARDRKGALVLGELEVADKSALEKSLDKTGLIPIAISPVSKIRFDFSKIKGIFERITAEELILFTRQISTLFGAGLPLTKALSTLEGQIKNKAFAGIIKKIREDIEAGSTFANALSKHPKIFNELYSSMAEAGEAGGILDKVLDRLASMLEKENENRAKIKSATLYPKIVLGAIVAAIFIMMTFVVPKFVQLYKMFNVALPLPTRMLIAISNFSTSYWHILLLIIVSGIIFVNLYFKTKSGRYNWDFLQLKIPIFGNMFLKSILSRFARTLGSLYASGLPILQALDIASRTAGNIVIAESVKTIEEDVRAGKGIAEPMARIKYFPPMVVQMAAVGEQTGAIDNMMEKVAEYYDQEVDHTIRNMSTILEPILLLFIFGIVLFLALAIFLPMWDMVRLIRR
ncbi:MAG: type II secretion system F family protein [Deltaproteobacteria bacterium]|nr:type II secretion system F family protein [Deltaproteobacteria bacterium]